MEPYHVSSIWIYPVKSLGGISLNKTRVFPKGLEFDRRWMLIDADNVFMSQRTFKDLAVFKTAFCEEGFLIQYHDRSVVLRHSYINKPIEATVWMDKVSVFEVDTEVSQWFSGLLGIDCRLVKFPETHFRPVDPAYAIHDEEVSLADGFPLLITGQRSLEELNRRMPVPVPMSRFRPNIVFAGGNPFAEDDWKYLKIGECHFASVKPCARCITTTINQETGQRGVEPLATLSTFRSKDNKVLFGQNLLLLKSGEITTGQEIILEKEPGYCC